MKTSRILRRTGITSRWPMKRPSSKCETSFLDAVHKKNTFAYVRFYPLVVLLMLSGSFSWAEEGVVVSNEEIGWRKSTGNLIYYKGSEKLFTGTVQVFGTDGSKQKEYGVSNGLRNGLWAEWYESGEKLMEANWNEGKKFGPTTWWYENGQKWKEIHYDENGKLVEKRYYSDGILYTIT